MEGPKAQLAASRIGEFSRGVVFGTTYDVPASGLTGTYWGGLVRVGSTNIGQPVVEQRVVGSTKLFTASKDTYVYCDSLGVLQYIEKTLGAAKPSQVDIGLNSEFIAKVVTSGTDITSVLDLRQMASRGRLLYLVVTANFVTAEQGDPEIPIHVSGRILAMYGHVTTALSGTDTGTVQLAIGENNVYVNVTNGLITGAISAAINTRYEAIPSGLNRVKAGNTLKFTIAKTTSGGGMEVTTVIEEA